MRRSISPRCDLPACRFSVFYSDYDWMIGATVLYEKEYF
jgi:hypothetical protein